MICRRCRSQLEGKREAGGGKRMEVVRARREKKNEMIQKSSEKNHTRELEEEE